MVAAANLALSSARQEVVHTVTLTTRSLTLQSDAETEHVALDAVRELGVNERDLWVSLASGREVCFEHRLDAALRDRLRAPLVAATERARAVVTGPDRLPPERLIALVRRERTQV